MGTGSGVLWSPLQGLGPAPVHQAAQIVLARSCLMTERSSGARAGAQSIFKEYYRGNSGIPYEREGLNELTFMVSFNPEIQDFKKDGV